MIVSGPVVDELDRHARAEDAGRDRDAELAESHAERLVDRLRLFGRRRVGEVGRFPSALSASSVNCETTSAAPPVSGASGRICPRGSKMRRRAILPASRLRRSPYRHGRHPGGRTARGRSLRRRDLRPRDALDDRLHGAIFAAGVPAWSGPFGSDPRRRRSESSGHPRGVLLRAGPQRARELVVPVRLRGVPLLLEAAAERVVRVVVGRRELEHRPELRRGLVVAADPEVRDARATRGSTPCSARAASPSRAARSPGRPSRSSGAAGPAGSSRRPRS